MITGAFIALISFGLGAGCMWALKTPKAEEKPDPYDKYRNKDGLLSRRKVKESG